MTLLELLYVMCFFLIVTCSVGCARAAHAHMSAYVLCFLAGVFLGALWVVAFYKAVQRVFSKRADSKTGLLLWIESASALLVMAVWMGLGGVAGGFAGEAIVHALA